MRKATLAAAVLLGGLILLLPSFVLAQTHPCDASAPTTITVSSGTAHKVQFCARPSDAPEAFTVYLDNVASDLRPLTLVVAASATGLALYEGPKELTFPTGNHVLQLTLWNREYSGGPSQESDKSDPLSLAALTGNPRAVKPIIKGIVR